MSIVQISYGKESRAKILAGAEKLNKAVSVTLGPAGRWILFRHMGPVFSTKDGVTVAREVNLPDPYESIGADLIKAAAGQAVDEAGDGTTTATLLAYAIFEAGCKAIDAGAEPVQLCRGIQRAVTAVVGDYDAKSRKFKGGILETLAVPCSPELAFQAAKISANGDESIAKVVSDAVLKVGVEGALTIGDSFSQDHVLEVAEGMQIEAGFAHPYLITDPQRNRAVYEDVTVCIIDRRVSTIDEATSIMEMMIKAAKTRVRPVRLLLICNEIDPEALNHIVSNKVKQQAAIPIVVVRSPLWGDQRRNLLDDLCLITGAKRIESPQGKHYESLTASQFGFAEKVVVTGSKTIITAPPFSEEYQTKQITPYLAGLKTIGEDEAAQPRDRDAAKSRLAALTGGVAVIKVGGTSGDTVRQTKFAVEDAIHATRAAVSDGVVPGGGSALLFARGLAQGEGISETQDHEQTGYNLLLDCLTMPIKQIAENAGYKGDVAQEVQDIDRKNKGKLVAGYDAALGIYPKNMITAGIVDPLRVVRSSLNAAAAAAAILLKTECVIAHDPVNSAKENYPGR